MEELINYLLQFGNLNERQLDFIRSRAKEFNLRKDQYFVEAGKAPKYVGFILEGVFRSCYYNNNGEEITNYFVDEYNFITDYQKFDAQLVTSEYVQAITDSKLLVFSKKDWDEICHTIVDWDKIVSKVFQKCLMNVIDRRSPLVSEDATTRYLSFIEKFPTLANRVPLSYVASYLGITQQSLSRIRRNLP